MIKLVPTWAYNYSDFWGEIRNRNIWFIKLRYGAVVALAVFVLLLDQVLRYELSRTQFTAITFIAIIILFYNIAFHYFRRYISCTPGKFNCLHFSLVQMMADLFTLGLLIFFTGGIESPIYLFYMFHMIIGSLILPGRVMYLLAAASIFIFASLSFLEFYGYIPHYSLPGFLSAPLYTKTSYVVISLTVFGFVIFMSVMFANSIAQQLYKIQQQLIRSIEKQERTEKDKQKYIMAITHEIKTPFSATNSLLSLILSKMLGPVNEQIEERLKRALIRTQEGIQLVDDVLKISRLRLLEDVHHEDIDIDFMMSNTIAKYRASIEAKRINLEFTDKRKKRSFIPGDRLLIELVFSNVMSNAVKYVENNATVQVNIEDAGQMVKITVSDNGVGIPEADMKKIFSDFFRASNVKKIKEGTGLGLSLVKQIVEKHNGSIQLKSPSDIGDPENPGTSVIIFLPVK